MKNAGRLKMKGAQKTSLRSPIDRYRKGWFAQRIRPGDVAVFENRQPVTAVKLITKKFIVYSIAWRYSSAGTEAE